MRQPSQCCIMWVAAACIPQPCCCCTMRGALPAMCQRTAAMLQRCCSLSSRPSCCCLTHRRPGCRPGSQAPPPCCRGTCSQTGISRGQALQGLHCCSHGSQACKLNSAWGAGGGAAVGAAAAAQPLTRARGRQQPPPRCGGRPAGRGNGGREAAAGVGVLAPWLAPAPWRACRASPHRGARRGGAPQGAAREGGGLGQRHGAGGHCAAC